MFLSGLVKLLTGDASWRDGTALNYHYLTQPLPAWTSYWAYQLPGWFQWLSVWIMFGIELLAPFLIFAGDAVDFLSRLPTRVSKTQRRCHFGRRSRQSAFIFLISLQLLITATGNFGFFNLLAMLLCVSLLDDEVFKVFPKWPGRRILPTSPAEQGGAKPRDEADQPNAASNAEASTHGIPPQRNVLVWCRLLGAARSRPSLFS